MKPRYATGFKVINYKLKQVEKKKQIEIWMWIFKVVSSQTRTWVAHCLKEKWNENVSIKWRSCKW